MTYVVAAAGLVATVLVYLGAKWIYRTTRSLLLAPLVVTPLLLAVGLLSLNVPYQTYMSGAKWIGDLLGPATVAFAVPIYRNRKLVKEHALELLAGAGLGALVGLVTSVLMARWLGLGLQMEYTLAPRSVTTPIAMEITRSLGGIPELTAVCVVVTGVWGTVAGPLVLRWLPIRSAVARGMMFGSASHGAGTARAFEIGQLEGTFSSLAMILTAFATLALAPLLLPWLR